jgi:hypothetical protein
LTAAGCAKLHIRGSHENHLGRYRVCLPLRTAETYHHGPCRIGSSPDETMSITVIVPEDGGEELAREFGLARARDFARRFSETAQERVN